MTTEGEAGGGVVRRRPRLDRLLETLGAAPVLEMLGVDAETLGRVQAGLEPLGEESWKWGPCCSRAVILPELVLSGLGTAAMVRVLRRSAVVSVILPPP